MANNIPVKPLSEIEVKQNVSENDKILILDSETEEARLADKEELRGDSWILYMTKSEYDALPQEQKMDWTSYFLWNDTADIVKALLRPYNNLLHYNDRDELYADLQLEDWMTPTSVFPVWIVVGNVSSTDWWSQNWVLVNALTADWHYLRWLYWADNKLYIDAWTWVFKEIATESTIDAKIQALRNELATVALTGKSSDLDNDAGFNSVPVMTEEEYEEIPWTAWDDKRYFIYDVVN